jgi:hypothetical protein
MPYTLRHTPLAKYYLRLLPDELPELRKEPELLEPLELPELRNEPELERDDELDDELELLRKLDDEFDDELDVRKLLLDELREEPDDVDAPTRELPDEIVVRVPEFCDVLWRKLLPLLFVVLLLLAAPTDVFTRVLDSTTLNRESLLVPVDGRTLLLLKP